MIQRSTLRSQIAGALRDEILAGRLPAGREFTVKEIAEQFGVSATPVREALVDLAAQGLLDVEHHRGFRVHEFTLDDYRSMVRARMVVLDGLFHGLFQGQAGGSSGGSSDGQVGGSSGGAVASGAGELLPPGPEATASVRRRAEAAERAAQAGDLDVLIGYDLRFWKELGSLVGNPHLCDFLDRMRIQCWVFSVPALRRQGELSGRLWAGHRELVDAVERRDAVEARRLIAAYNNHALSLAEQLSRNP